MLRPDTRYEWIADAILRQKVQAAWRAYSVLQAEGVYRGWQPELIVDAKAAWEEYDRLTKEAAR